MHFDNIEEENGGPQGSDRGIAFISNPSRSTRLVRRDMSLVSFGCGNNVLRWELFFVPFTYCHIRSSCVSLTVSQRRGAIVDCERCRTDVWHGGTGEDKKSRTLLLSILCQFGRPSSDFVLLPIALRVRTLRMGKRPVRRNRQPPRAGGPKARVAVTLVVRRC